MDIMSENDLVNRARGEAFVGRQDELARLASAAAEVAGSGRGQLVVIAGDAGMGKSRLVQEFGERANREGWTTATGGCVDVAAGALTYAALIEIFRHLNRQLGREVMAKLAGAGIDDLAALLPGVPGAQPGAGGLLLERMLDFLMRLGEVAPAAVVVEDLHWADSSTRDLISFLARNIRAARVLLIVTYRADDLHRRHPLKSLLAELERGDAAWIRLAGLEALDASIQAARWASLVGAPSEAADHLETALTLWEQTPAASHPDGADRAALLEQAAKARSAAGQALRARTLAEAAVTELAGSADVERVALAHLQVGVYSRLAGEAAASAEAFQRSVGLLADRPPSPAKAFVMARYAGFLMVGQRVRQGLAAVEAALDLARRTGSRRLEGHAMGTKGALLIDVGMLEEGLRLMHDSGEIAREVGEADDLARAFQNLTYVQLFAGLADEALAAADAGLQVVRRLGTMLSSGIGITEHQAEAAVRVGRWDEALALLDAFPYDALEGSTLVSFAAPRFDVFLRRGELDAAARTLAPAIERAAAMDDAQFGANTRIRAAQLALATGRLDDARAHISAALAISDRCDDLIYAPKACSVGISAEAACPAPDLGTVEALATRLSGMEARAGSFGGPRTNPGSV